MVYYSNSNIPHITYLTTIKSENKNKNKNVNLICKNTYKNNIANGIWIWNTKNVISNEKYIINNLKKENIKTVYIQINKNLDQLIPFLREAQETHIKVWALDGNPDDINNYLSLIDDINRIKIFNINHKNAAFEGFQIDVEPYLKQDWNLNEYYYVNKYVEMLISLKNLISNTMKFSIVIPFWFDNIKVNNSNLAFFAINIANEVVIMSYRTDLKELLDISSNDLAYAQLMDKPIKLGIETSYLPDERHFIIKTPVVDKFCQGVGNYCFLDKTPFDGLPFVNTYEVKSDKLTFFKKRNQLQQFINQLITLNNFKGYVINNYESFFQK